MISRGLGLPRAFERDAQWGFDTSKRPPAERDGYRPPVKLGVLLPITGNLATVAAPVRDGLLAGYYAETRRRPEVQFFDTAGTPAGANAAYDKAVSAGVDYVVGPLGRDEVSALFARGQLAVPVLALNRPTDNKAPPSGSAGFSLAPEDDGIMAAEYLLSRERRNVLIVGTSDDNGKRTIKAFRDRFTERGGTVAGSISVADAPGDIGAQLRNYGTADAVFLAVRGNTARALAPQLALAGFAGKSRVGTSQLVAGTGKVEDDLVLDGIVYPSETWTVLGVSGLPAVSEVASTLPSARGPAARLFAFGYDAWKITAYLEKNSPPAAMAACTAPPAPCTWMASAMCCARRPGPPSAVAVRPRSPTAAEAMPAARQQRGAGVEAAARALLEQAGLRLVVGNANYRGGELDLVMRDGQSLVFVEVRYRRDDRFGGGAASVDWRKRRKLVLAAQLFLALTPHWQRCPAASMWSMPAANRRYCTGSATRSAPTIADRRRRAPRRSDANHHDPHCRASGAVVRQ